jgi:hypothetical protein
MHQAYPLSWPVGYKRTRVRTASKFSQTGDKAQQFLRAELQRLGAAALILSSNCIVRADGYVYADMSNAKLEDPGVAIYFKYKGKDISMCCDTYQRVWENIYALGKSIEAIRAIERYGVSEFIERAFTGFKELPMQTEEISITWWSILGVAEFATQEEIKIAFRKLSLKYHPDNAQTGDAEKFIQIKAAYDHVMAKMTV